MLTQKQVAFHFSYALILLFVVKMCLGMTSTQTAFSEKMFSFHSITPNADAIEKLIEKNQKANASLFPSLLNQEEKNLWERLRKGMQFEEYLNHPRVQKFIKAYARAPHELSRITNNARPYLYLILNEVESRGLPAELALLPMIESGYEPHARSRVGATGLWQIMPRTAHFLGLKRGPGYDGRKDVVASTLAALDYLESFQDSFHDDWLLSLASYNAGEGNVRLAQRRNQRQGLAKSYWDLPLPRETRDYVPKLLAVAAILKNPEKYGVELPEIANTAVITQVQVAANTPVQEAARLAEMNVEQLFQLNPGYQKGAKPKQTYILLLPLQNANRFSAHMRQLKRT